MEPGVEQSVCGSISWYCPGRNGVQGSGPCPEWCFLHLVYASPSIKLLEKGFF